MLEWSTAHPPAGASTHAKIYSFFTFRDPPNSLVCGPHLRLCIFLILLYRSSVKCFPICNAILNYRNFIRPLSIIEVRCLLSLLFASFGYCTDSSSVGASIYIYCAQARSPRPSLPRPCTHCMGRGSTS
jgi:hypothetical protein